MKRATFLLWHATFFNSLLSILLFALFFGALWVTERRIPSMVLLKWGDPAWCVGIPASVIGVAYTLSIRNPANFTGFYLGIVMSALLGVQFFLMGNYDLVFLYFCIFIPFQIRSILRWRTSSETTEAEELPAFLSWRGMLASFGVFALLTLVDFGAVAFFTGCRVWGEGALLRLLGALLLSSSVLANYWLIYRRNDAWLYWIVYSVVGVIFYILVGNAFSVVLFLFFLAINSSACIAWIKATPRSRFGWLTR